MQNEPLTAVHLSVTVIDAHAEHTEIDIVRRIMNAFTNDNETFEVLISTDYETINEMKKLNQNKTKV